MPKRDYTTLRGGDGQLAGIMDATAFLPDGVPGGAIILPAEDTPYGRLAQAADPTGAHFKLVAGS